MNATFSKKIVLPVANTVSPPPKKEKILRLITIGESNCTRLTPKFPTPACMPKAVPDRRLGKNKEVEGI